MFGTLGEIDKRRKKKIGTFTTDAHRNMRSH